MLNELDPQVKVLLEQFQANPAKHPAPAIPLSAEEKIIALRQMMGSPSFTKASAVPSESVSKTEDFAIPGPAGKIPVRLYVPHTIIQSGWRGIREDPQHKKSVVLRPQE
jgi:acetyl esterase/lipase